MRGKLLAYALAISVGVHIIVLCILGRTAQVRQVTLDQSQPIQVSVIKSPDDNPKPVQVSPPKVIQQPRPLPTPAAPTSHPITPIRPAPRPNPVISPAIHMPPPKTFVPAKQQPRAPSVKPAGNPGGALNTGSISSRGENLGTSGRTPVGWVSGDRNGRGIGSGKGGGVGRPEPVKEAVDGPGREPAPTPAPPPDIHIRVCAKSGMLPGPYCEETVMRSFRPGKEPTSTCTLCRPKQKSVLADRSIPELISGPKRPKYPESAIDGGIQGSVTLEYTINTEGRVVNVKVVSSAGDADLDEAAINTVKSRKYKPAIQAGIPRNYRKRETFHFELD